MKVYIAQGGGFSRLVKSDNDTEKNLYWLKKVPPLFAPATQARILYEWLHCRYSILMRCKQLYKNSVLPIQGSDVYQTQSFSFYKKTMTMGMRLK